MFFIKKLFRIVNSSPEATAGSKIPPDPVKEPVDYEEDERPLVCDNSKSGWAKKRIPANIKHLPHIDMEI